MAPYGTLEFDPIGDALGRIRDDFVDVDVDVGHVTRCHPVAAVLLDAMIELLGTRGVTVVTVDRLERRLFEASAEFPIRGEALDWCQGHRLVLDP